MRMKTFRTRVAHSARNSSRLEFAELLLRDVAFAFIARSRPVKTVPAPGWGAESEITREMKRDCAIARSDYTIIA